MQENKKYKFRKVFLPESKVVFIPSDIQISLPVEPSVANERLHLLAFIPWDEKYINHIPTRYVDFFRYVLHYLDARTTDVHTAFSVSFLSELIASTPETVNKTILYIAVILHDSGWARLSPGEIADSLDYSSLDYSPRALKPKEMHATIGAQMAEQLLHGYHGALGITDTQRKFICDLVYYHDQIRPWPKKPEPIEYLLLSDADRLWSYTYENFWLDTIRKNTEPSVYLGNLETAIDSFFLTEQGKIIARRLIAERAQEVARFPVRASQLADSLKELDRSIV